MIVVWHKVAGANDGVQSNDTGYSLVMCSLRFHDPHPRHGIGQVPVELEPFYVRGVVAL